MRRRTALLACAFNVLLWVTPADAQPQAPPLTSNRPGIADSESLVAPRVFQVEAGVQWQQAPSEAEREWTQTWGQLTVRYGLRPWLELFTGWDGLSLDRVSVDGTSRVEAGGNDLRFGAKVAVLSEERHGVMLTLAPGWSVPVGGEEFSSGSNDASFRVLWARSLPADWSLSGNVLFTRTSDSGGRYWDNLATLSVGRPLRGSVTTFVEGVTAVFADRPDVWTVDGGIAWTRGPDVQWDISAGRAFRNDDEKWFLSAGVTLRRRR
jgi:hypothetical protein